jgi:hypothetical protein
MIERDDTMLNLGFAVIGDDEDNDDPGGSDPGSVWPFQQTLFRGSPGSWDKGEVIGSADGVYIVLRGGGAQISVTLRLNAEELAAGQHTIVANGTLPYGDDRLGEGEIPIAGGTGRYKALRGVLRLEVMNPKRWTVEA